MDLREQLAALRTLLRRGRTVPMSASCIVNRTDALAALDEVERALPGELAEASTILANREAMLAEATAQAEHLVEEGRRERAELVRNTSLHAEARAAADDLLARAQSDAAGLRQETDDYVDHKLASFEVALNNSIRTARDAVEQIRERSAVEVAPMLGIDDDPAKLTREVDRWVETKLDRFESALHKTLDTVVKGREKLRERSQFDHVRDDDADTGAIPRVRPEAPTDTRSDAPADVRASEEAAPRHVG